MFWSAVLAGTLASVGLATEIQTPFTKDCIVPGKAFDRIVFIWLENTDYEMAIGDPNLAYLASKGITLNNSFALTHPSQPNYVASIGGDTWGMDNDHTHNVPANISTVIDLLEDRGISWAEYMEGMPWTGFTGNFPNPTNGRNMYVRKHNPAISYESVTSVPSRLAQIKNFTEFYDDLEANALPQWITLTPDMTNDGHDTSVTVAGAWSRSFLEPLLSDQRFMQNTAVLLTFDENETYSLQNRILGILLGDAIPADLVGTTDSTFYDHYSQLATVEANWNLHTLGRFDVGANVYSFAAQKTGDVDRGWTTPHLSTVKLASSYPGLFNSIHSSSVPLPAPNVSAEYANRTVLPAIQQLWAVDQANSYYSTALEVPDGARPPGYHGGAQHCGGDPSNGGSSSGGSSASILLGGGFGWEPAVVCILLGFAFMV